ncbi:ATP-binding protein [Actinomycetota bacterium Odt1-20B]
MVAACGVSGARRGPPTRRRYRVRNRAAPVLRRTVGQILDVFLDNTREHGRGRTEVTARSLGDATALDVRDEGSIRGDLAGVFDRGHTTGAGSGIGWALAKDLAEAAGGGLVLADVAPTIFTLLVQAERSDAVN